MSGGGPGTVLVLKHVGVTGVVDLELKISSVFICHRYIQGASSPKDMVILVDV